MLGRNSLSVVIITHNESGLLADCLASVSWADEIIVLDYCSNDATRRIALLAGGLFFQSKDWFGFGIQRQKAQSYASCDYILMLDADERVTPLLRKEIQELLYKPNYKEVVYRFIRYNFFLNRFMYRSGWYSDRVVRLYSRNHYFYNSLPVHESLEIKNAIIVDLIGSVQHFTCCNLFSFQYKQLRYAEIWAIESYKQNRKCYIFTIIYHTIASFFKTWLLRASFLDGKYGFLLAIINAQYTFNKYAILWSLSKSLKGKK